MWVNVEIAVNNEGFNEINDTRKPRKRNLGSKFRLLIHPKTQNPNRVLSDFQLILQILLQVIFNLYLFPSSKLNVYVVVHFFLFAAFFSPRYGCKRFRILFDGEVHGFFFLHSCVFFIFFLIFLDNVVGYVLFY